MATYVMADLHLSKAEGCNKQMDVFGRRWTGYAEKIEKNWRAIIAPEDDVVIPGDISWALSSEEAVADLAFLDSLPGRKYLGKGNHDLWWASMRKNLALCEAHHLTSISFLYNNAIETQEFILAGTRGWFYDQDATGIPVGADFEKLVAREASRLKMSLTAAAALPGSGEKETLVFMHFPTVFGEKTVEPILSVLECFGIRRVYYGHIHGNYVIPKTLERQGVEFTLISADYLDFVPHRIRPL